jgi:hypothetical protein
MNEADSIRLQQGEPESRNGRLDAAATPPAEASCVSGDMPTSMGTSALSSEMAMGRRIIAKSGLFSLLSIEEVHLQGGAPFWVVEEPFSVRRCGL